MQSDCLYRYSSLFFEHYNRVLLCDWVPGGYTINCEDRNALVLRQALARVALCLVTCAFHVLLLDVVLYQVLRVSEQLC